MGTQNERAAMSIAQAANYTGLSRSTLYRLMDAGDLPSIKIAGRRLIRPAALDALLDAGAKRGAE